MSDDVKIVVATIFMLGALFVAGFITGYFWGH